MIKITTSCTNNILKYLLMAIPVETLYYIPNTKKIIFYFKINTENLIKVLKFINFLIPQTYFVDKSQQSIEI